MEVFNNKIGFDTLKSFQLGGAINITDDKKKELFPYFAYVYSQQMNPEKYGSVQSIEEWTALIQENEKDIKTITKAAAKLSNDDWDKLNQQYAEAQSTSGKQDIVTAAKGTKLQKLSDNKNKKPIQLPVLATAKGGKVKPKKTKCSCGCDLILSKAEGGKVISTCSCKCGGKIKKKK